jgi:RNA-directed DNA polymerase
MREGFDFLGFHIKWMRKRGTDKWFVYTWACHEFRVSHG